MAGNDPVFSEQGDRVEAALQERLETIGALNADEVGGVAEIVAAAYQKALQLRYVVESIDGAPDRSQQPADQAALADGPDAVEEILGTLATWHATTRVKLYYAAQKLRLSS
jgi:hypothetical protein